MRNFLRIFKPKYDIKSYCSMDLENAKKSIGMVVITALLRETNEAVKNQPFLKNDTQVLAEKAINKMHIKSIIVANDVSYQKINDEYFYCLHTAGLWEMLLDKFIDFKPCITEREFRDVAHLLMLHLKERSKQEEIAVTEIAGSFVHLREDGRVEIVFPGKIWGGKELVESMLHNAERAGVCFVEIKSSPINKKAILPSGWKLLEKADLQGYTFILDDENRKRGTFRLKRLPDYSGNGEFDFFFDERPGQVIDMLNKPKILCQSFD